MTLDPKTPLDTFVKGILLFNVLININMPIFASNNNQLYTASNEFRIMVNNVDTWRYNWANGCLFRPTQSICQPRVTYGYGNPGNNAVLPWDTVGPIGGFKGPSSAISTANRFTAPASGFYRVSWTQLCLYRNEIWVSINGSRPINGAHGIYGSSTGHYTSIGMSTVYPLNAGDFLELRINSNGYNTYATWGWSRACFERIG